MAFRYLGAIILVCLVTTGCRRDAYVDTYLEMLNAEKRELEDRVYELEYDYERALEELEELRGNKSSEEGVGRQADVSEPIEEPDFLPEIQLPPGLNDGAEESDGPLAPESAATGPQPISSVRSVGREISRQADSEPASVELDERIDYVYINPRLTGGEDFDQRPGDDGLAVMIEPRNKDGIFVPKPAPVTIVLLDPVKDARYAHWEFDRDVAEEVLRTESLNRGLLFRVPWSGTPPDSDRLHLFVRYTTADGRKLEADRLITIRPPGRVAQGWTPRTSDSQGRDAAR